MSATQPPSGSKTYLRWQHEILFSLNLCFLTIPLVSFRIKYPLLMRGRDLVNFIYAHSPSAISSLLRDREPYSQYLLALILVLSGALLLILRITARLPVTISLLRTVPGVAALVGLPLVLRLLQPFPLILLFEGFAAAACALFYLYGKWKLNPLVTISVLALHFAFWTWGTLGKMWFALAYPVLGFCSVLTWAVFAKQVNKAPHVPEKTE